MLPPFLVLDPLKTSRPALEVLPEAIGETPEAIRR